MTIATMTRAAAILVIATSAACDPAPEPRPPAAAIRPAASREAPAVPVVRQISGHLVGHDGKPMRFAEVRVGDQSVTAGTEGRYEITAPAAGVARVTFSGVDHATTVVPIVDPGAIALDVVLGTHPRPQPVAAVRLVVFGHGDHGELVENPRIAMRRQPDGAFAATVDQPADDLIYGVVIGDPDRVVNGTQAAWFSFHDDDYASHVAAPIGRTTIRFDPRLLPPPSRPARVSFARASRMQVELARIDRELVAQPPAGASAAAARRGELDRALAAERDPALHRALLAAWFAAPIPRDATAPVTRELVARAIADIPADSTLWELWPQALAGFTDGSVDPAVRAYAERAALGLTDHATAAGLVFSLGLAARRDGRTADLQRLHDELGQRYADTRLVQKVLGWLDPRRKIRAGQPIPAFDLASLEPRGGRITRDGLRGKLVLLELWATWCTGCVAQMANLHAAYQAFHGRGLDIVSIDASESAEVIAAFRRARWPMPWHHATASEPAIAALFEVVALPTTILVDAAGTIVATDEDLAGAALARTIERVLRG